MLSKPSKKGPSQSLCIGRSSSREYQTDPEKQAENSVFEFFNRIDPNPSVELLRSGLSLSYDIFVFRFYEAASKGLPVNPAWF